VRVGGARQLDGEPGFQHGWIEWIGMVREQDLDDIPAKFLRQAFEGNPVPLLQWLIGPKRLLTTNLIENNAYSFLSSLRMLRHQGEHGMLTYEDCLALVELTPEQIGIIAARQHIPDMVALELGSELCRTAEGERRIKDMILEAIEAARAHGDTLRAAQLQLTLGQFMEAHPRAC
jgi:hypothetical protein